MGLQENRHATEIRRRLLTPPNAVEDAGIDLKRGSRLVPPAAPESESPPACPPQATEPTVPEPSPSNILPFVPKKLTALRVIELVAKHTGYGVAAILSDSRKGKVTLARHIAIWMCIKHFPERSLPQHGLTFDRDHTSIIHARDRIKGYLNSDSTEGESIRRIIRRVEEEIRHGEGWLR